MRQSHHRQGGRPPERHLQRCPGPARLRPAESGQGPGAVGCAARRRGHRLDQAPRALYHGLPGGDRRQARHPDPAGARLRSVVDPLRLPGAQGRPQYGRRLRLLPAWRDPRSRRRGRQSEMEGAVGRQDPLRRPGRSCRTDHQGLGGPAIGEGDPPGRRPGRTPSSPICAKGRRDGCSTHDPRSPVQSGLPEQSDRPADPRDLLGAGGNLEPEDRYRHGHRPDPGDRLLQPVHLDDPPADSQLDPDDRADGDHRLAGDRRRPGAQGLCL